MSTNDNEELSTELFDLASKRVIKPKYKRILFFLISVIFLIFFINMIFPIQFHFKSELTVNDILYFIGFILSLILSLNTITKTGHFTSINFELNQLGSLSKYELRFSIRNRGYLKFRLIKAFYFIEKQNISASSKDFFQFTDSTYKEDMKELSKKFENLSDVSAYKLTRIEKSAGVYFSPLIDHSETEVHNFDTIGLYKITFYIFTTSWVSYYTSKYLLIEKNKKEK